MHTGSCLCGQISYQIEGELGAYGYCHCNSCRKGSGSAFGANVGLDRDNFALSDSHGLLREYESSPGKFRTFCSNCGSPLFAYLGKTPKLVRIRLGSLDTEFAETVSAHTFVSDKATWEEISGDAPQFDEWASPDVLVQTGSRQP